MDAETFLTTLYVSADDFCKAQPSGPAPCGPDPALSPGEVLTLAVCGQWALFLSERSFYRWVWAHWRGAFPSLPDRAQYNRLVRAAEPLLTAFGLWLGSLDDDPHLLYEAVDTTGCPVRNKKRRGRSWLWDTANYGWSTRLGFYFGFHLLVCCRPDGAVTGWGFAPAADKDVSLFKTFFAARCRPQPRLPSVGQFSLRRYLADSGADGRLVQAHWREVDGAWVLAPPTNRPSSPPPWPEEVYARFAGWRQIIETVFARLEDVFGLARERPHALDGFAARLAARISLHNFCLWLNRRLGRPLLEVATLVTW